MDGVVTGRASNTKHHPGPVEEAMEKNRGIHVDGIDRGRPAITNKILTLLIKLRWKRILVANIERSLAIPILTLALVKITSVESAN